MQHEWESHIFLWCILSWYNFDLILCGLVLLVIILWSWYQILLQASFMPVLVLAARLCPQGMEATLFATLMSISNGGSVVGGLVGAGLTQLFGVTKDSFDNLTFLIILCNLSSLLPLPLLGLLPQDNPDDASTKETEDIEMKCNWIWILLSSTLFKLTCFTLQGIF